MMMTPQKKTGQRTSLKKILCSFDHPFIYIYPVAMLVLLWILTKPI